MQNFYVDATSNIPVRASAIIDDFNIFGAVHDALAAYDSYASALASSGSGITLHSNKKWAMWVGRGPPPDSVKQELRNRGLTLVSSSCRKFLYSAILHVIVHHLEVFRVDGIFP